MPDSNSMVDKAVNIVHITSLANLKTELLNYGKLIGTTAGNNGVYCSTKGTPPEVPSGTIIYSNNNQSNGNGVQTTSSSSSSGFGSGFGSGSSSGFGSGSTSGFGSVSGSGFVGGPVRGQVVSSKSVGGPVKGFILDSEDPQLYEEQLQQQEQEQQLKVRLQQEESKLRDLEQRTQQRVESPGDQQQQTQLQQEQTEIRRKTTMTRQELQELTQKQTETQAKIKQQQQQQPISDLDKKLENLSLSILELIYRYRIPPTIVQRATTPPEVKKIDDLYNDITSGKIISSSITRAFKVLPIQIYQTRNKTNLADQLVNAFNELSANLGSKKKISDFGKDLNLIKQFIDSLKKGVFTNVRNLLDLVIHIFERSKVSYFPEETSTREENNQAVNRIFDELLEILRNFQLNGNDMINTQTNHDKITLLETTFKELIRYTRDDPYLVGGRPIIKRKTKKNKRKKTKRKTKKRKTRRRRRR